MKEPFLIAALFLLLSLGCKSGTSSANNVAVDKMRPANVTTVNAATPIEVNVSSSDISEAQSANAACPDPAKPCHHKQKKFDDWELSFKMPAKLKANTPYRSAPFFAIILKTFPMGDDCDSGEFISSVETERKRAQAGQLSRKVFASYECPNMGAVNYDFDGRMDEMKENILIGNFIAVYVGTTKEEAERELATIRSKFPTAQLKKMTAIFEVIEQ